MTMRYYKKKADKGVAPVMTNSIIEPMKNDEWLKTSDEKQKEQRLLFLKSFIKPCSHYCPDCHTELISNIDEDETYCPSCGLITSMSTEYVAGQKIDLPHGRH